MAKETIFVDITGNTWRVVSIDASGVYAATDPASYQLWTARELAEMGVNINNLAECAR